MAGLIKWVVIIAALGALYNYFGLGEKSEGEKVADYAVREINKMKGKMVDNQTLLKGAYTSPRGLVINYQLIDFQVVAFDREEMNKKLLANAKRKNCGKRDIMAVLDMDITVSYVYFNAIDKQIAKVSMDKNTCG